MTSGTPTNPLIISPSDLADLLAARFNALHPELDEPDPILGEFPPPLDIVPCRHGRTRPHYPNGGNSGFRCVP